MQTRTASSPLVYLTLASHQGRAQLHEDAMVSELNLYHAADDPQLLTALAVVSDSIRPLVPRQISLPEDLLVLWLSDDEWLVLPAARYGHDLEQALHSTFGDEISLELIPDGSFQALLSDKARAQIENAEAHPLGSGVTEGGLKPARSICIRPWATLSAYDLVLSQADTELLRGCLNSLQH